MRWITAGSRSGDDDDDEKSFGQTKF